MAVLNECLNLLGTNTYEITSHVTSDTNKRFIPFLTVSQLVARISINRCLLSSTNPLSNPAVPHPCYPALSGSITYWIYRYTMANSL